MTTKTKKNLTKAIALTTGLTMALTAVQPAFANVLRSPAVADGKITTSDIVNKIGQWGLVADLRLFKKDLFDGIGIRGGYRYEVEPSFNDGLMTRYDRYYINMDGKADTLKDKAELVAAKESDFGVGVGLLNALEFTFARQFVDTNDAVEAKPYFYDNLPFTAEKALNGLKPGDYFSMKTNLGVVVSGSFLQGLNASLALDLSAHYLVQGSFQIHALRLPDDKLRLKLVGLRNKEKGLSVGIGYEGILNIFKYNRLNKQITSILDLDPAKVSGSKGSNNLFMVDYVVNLKDEQSVKAYDQVLKNARDVKSVAKTVKKNVSIQELKDQLLMDIEPLDVLAREDIAASQSGKRVGRSFKGSLAQEYQKGTLDLGIRLVSLMTGGEYSENNITSLNDNEEKDYFVLNSYNMKSENNFFFSWLQTKKDVRMNAAFRSDSTFKKLKAEDMVISVVRKDKRFREAEFKGEVIDQLKRTLPDIVRNQIDFNSWNTSGEKLNNVAIRYQVVMHPEIMGALPQYSADTLTEMYLDYLRGLRALDLVKSAAFQQRAPKLMETDERDVYDFHLRESIEKIANKLAKALDRSLPGDQRLQALMSLRKNPIFLKTGVRFFLELLPQDEGKLKQLIQFDMHIESSDGDRLDFTFGDKAESDIHKRLLTIQNLIENGGLDLRLEGETLKINLLNSEVVR